MSLMTTVTAIAATELRAALRHNLRLAAVYGVAGLGVLGAIGFGLSALHRVIAMSQGSLNADLIIGGALLVIAAILIGVAKYMSYRARRRAAMTRALAAAPLAASLLLKKPKFALAAVVAAVVVGGLAGRSFMK